MNTPFASEEEQQHLLELTKQMRAIYPPGAIPGTTHYYRSNSKEVALRLKKFFQQWGEYSDEEILKATKRYVESFHGDYRYLKLLKYFISKNDLVPDEDGLSHVVETSKLADLLENEDTELPSDDWLYTSRN